MQVFQIEGETLTSVAARNLTLTLTPAEGIGVTIRAVINSYPAEPHGNGVRFVTGDVYDAEDKAIAIEIEVPAHARARKSLPLLDVMFSYEPVISRDGETTLGDRVEGRLAVVAAVAKDAEPGRLEVRQQVARARVARAKELSIELTDREQPNQAAEALRATAGRLRQDGLDEEFELAEEVAQLDYFADTIAAGPLGTDDRKVLRDQAFQGRTRNRADLTARGGSGGSAKGLEAADSADRRVELRCVRDAGKLRMQILTPGYEPDFRVLFPRGIRQEGVHYVVDTLELSQNGTFYRPSGTIRRLTKSTKAGIPVDPTADPADPLALVPLFAGGAETWMPLLRPVIEAQARAADFIGPKRDPGVVPVRELTFQALKPNPPHKWKVVVFGQNP